MRHSLSQAVLRLPIAAIGAYAGVCVIVDFLQTRLVYFPSRDYHSTPRDVGLSFTPVTLTASDGLRIAAWVMEREDSRGSVIICHGNGGNMADRLVEYRAFHEMGLRVVAFDYRGYGESEGSPAERGTYLDADAAWSYATRVLREPADRIVLYGESLGGAVAIELASRHPPAALVVQATFTSLADVGALHYPLLPVRMLLRHRYESINRVEKIFCPKLFLHATADELVPLENARRLFEAAAEPKQFLETPGEHNTGGFLYAPKYTRAVQAFILSALPPSDDSGAKKGTSQE